VTLRTLSTSARAFFREPRHVVASLRLLVFVGLSILGWSDPPSQPFLFWTITVVYGITVMGYLMAQNGDYDVRRVRYAIFLFDVAVVCGLLVLRGRDVQALVMAYAMLVLLAGLMAGIGTAFVNALIVSAAFTVFTGWGVPPETLLTVERLSPVLFFFVIAVFMGHVANDARRRSDPVRKPGSGVPALRTSTARLRAARDGVQAEDRLQTLGLLSAGIAHELRAPLAAITSGASDGPTLLADLRAALAAGGPTDGMVAELEAVFADVRHAAERLQRVAADLDQAGRCGTTERRAVPASETLESAARMLRNVAGSSVRIDVRPGSHRTVRGDPARLLQVLLILGDNAVAAMQPRGGVLTLEAEDVGQERVAFLVSDTGPGMSEDTLCRMYDPFFTTKGPGQGTGLGLYVLREIVHAFGGQVGCQSADRRGTRFRVELPALEVAPVAADAA